MIFHAIFKVLSVYILCIYPNEMSRHARQAIPILLVTRAQCISLAMKTERWLKFSSQTCEQ